MPNPEFKNTIIAGPCAVESHMQIISTAKELKERRIGIVRASLWKPRTEPSDFEGVGPRGISWLVEAAEMGMTVATEVMLPEQATLLIKDLVKQNEATEFIFWLGARNQNQFIQRDIAKVLAGEENIFLMIKNQLWRDEKHWVGIFNYVVKASFPKERILMCHRGFSSNGNSPDGFRNTPDFEMAMRVKEKTNVPMIIDPSHIAGDAKKVPGVIKQALGYNFNGFMLEVHPNPAEAKTDRKQQLNFQQLDGILREIKLNKRSLL